MTEHDSNAEPLQPLLTMALEHANDGVLILECAQGRPPFVIRYANAMLEQQTGYTREELIGRDAGVLYGPLTDRGVVDELTRSLLGLQSVTGEVRKYRKDGSWFWAEVSIRPIPGPDGRIRAAIVIQRDVTEHVTTKEELELLSAAMDYANDGIVVFRWDAPMNAWRIRHVNEMFLKLTGYDIGEVIGGTTDFLFGGLTDVQRLQSFRMALHAGQAVRGEFAFYRKDGGVVWTEINGQGLRDVDGAISHTIIVYRDVTEKHMREERLTFEASHDPLTGVFNRRFFVDALEEALGDARRRTLRHGLLFFDLDGFKPVNDTYGHEAGDRLLIEVTSAVCSRLRHGDILARMGGDEFGVLLFGCPPEQAEKIAGDMLAAMRDFVLLWQGKTVRIGASIGVVPVDGTCSNAADLLRRADAACYAAKNAGRNRVVLARA